MKILFAHFFLLIGIFSFIGCSPEEDPSPVSTSIEVEALLSKNWDLHDYHLESNSDSALFYIQKVKIIAKENDKQDWLASSYYQIAYTHFNQGNISDAAYHYLKASQMFKKIGDLTYLAKSLTSLGDIYAKAQDYKTALSYFKEANDIYLYQGTSADKIKIYRNLAICYKETKDYVEAENMLNLAMSITTETGAEGYDWVSRIYNMQGATKFEQKRFKEARDFYSLSMQHLDKIPNNHHIKATAYNNFGETYLKEGDFNLAEEWLNKAITIKEEIGDPTFTQSTINNLGRLRIEQEQYEEAALILENGISNIPPGTIDPAVEEGLALMMEALVKTNARGTPAQYAHLNRQLATYSQKLMAYNTKLSDLKQQLETTSKQQALQLALEKHTLGNQLEAAEEKNKQIQYAFIVPVLLLIAASISIYLAIRRNRNAKQLINAIDDVLNKRHQNIAR